MTFIKTVFPSLSLTSISLCHLYALRRVFILNSKLISPSYDLYFKYVHMHSFPFMLKAALEMLMNEDSTLLLRFKGLHVHACREQLTALWWTSALLTCRQSPVPLPRLVLSLWSSPCPQRQALCQNQATDECVLGVRKKCSRSRAEMQSVLLQFSLKLPAQEDLLHSRHTQTRTYTQEAVRTAPVHWQRATRQSPWDRVWGFLLSWSIVERSYSLCECNRVFVILHSVSGGEKKIIHILIQEISRTTSVRGK